MRATARVGQRQAPALLAAIAFVIGFLISPAAAFSAFSGYATIRQAVHASGNTLSGQGIEIVGPRATSRGGVIALTIDSLEVGGTRPWANSPAALTFRHGQDSLRLSEIHFDFARRTLEGSLGGQRIAVFRLATIIDIEPATLSVSFTGGRLQLTGTAAKILRNRFALEGAVALTGVGQISMGATETTVNCPPPQPRGDPTKPPPPPSECVPQPSPEEIPPLAPTP